MKEDKGAELMGHVGARVKLVNTITGSEVDEDGLIDTGATYTVVPQRLHDLLKTQVVGKKTVETAKGPLELEESFAIISIDGKSGIAPILISKEVKDLLIGVITLEALGLTVDPTTGKLKEARILLF